MDRKKAYFLIMGTCITLIVLAWTVVRLFSVPVAIAMSAVAAVLPPIAAIVGNQGALDDQEQRREERMLRGDDQSRPDS